MATPSARTRATRAARQLALDFPHAECALRFANPLELLIATILSAQCTDVRVNQVTEDLFSKYRTAADYAAADLAALEHDLRQVNFFRNKAKNIKACCQALCERHQGEVPADLPALTALAGVGRKTANVVLGTAFGLPTGVVVDTHVKRLSRRMGLSQETDPEKIEADLMRLLPQDQWIGFSHRMILHGRTVCNARKPQCETCSCRDWCPQLPLDSADE